MVDNAFVHLHLHSDYSLLDGAIQLKPLVKRVAELGMGAVAVTDHGNLFGAVSFYNAAKDQGIKPIIGCEAYLAAGGIKQRRPSIGSGEKANHHIVLLASSDAGYQNLVRLCSRAYTEGFYYKPRIDREMLAKHSEGLIALSACLSGVPASLLSQDKFDEAVTAACEFEEIFGRGNYFLEIQEHGLDAQARIRNQLVELSSRTRIPLVATNDAHYLRSEDWEAHDVLLCIGSGKTVSEPNRKRYGTPNFFVRSPSEMWEIFGAELPDALLRTVEIAERCAFEMQEGEVFVPSFPLPAEFGNLTENQYFQRVVTEGFQRRKELVWDRMIARGELRRPLDEYAARLAAETEMIQRIGYAGYFLIVWDFIKYARLNSIPVGPGRGSAAGSLVAYCMEITDIDPLQYDLLFERFLNPERVTLPDIDIDFCVRGRGDVINHVAGIYGRDSVCQIITFGTMASRAAIKDVGRALDMPFAEVERIAKLIPPPVRGRNVSIAQALEQVPELRQTVENSPQVEKLIDLAKRLEGCARHTSVHAAGVVISPRPLQELIPIAVSSKDEVTTQYPMADLEKTGMLKMDFLGLTALTVINDCLASIKQSLGVEIEWQDVPLDDEATMKLFSEGKTDAVFQFESSGMQEICRKLRPKGLEDLAALNALYRPGPLDGGMVEDFIQRHHGLKAVKYIVPEMKDVLANTYGILVYQEQIMQLAQKLGGYSLGEADLMRRAMGKKKREEMALHEEKFVRGAVERGIRGEKAKQIFSLMAQFADYGFNRSHSVAYAFLAFQTAYLKAHYAEHFYAAVLSHESQDSSKVYKYTKELRAQGIEFLPPDVNESNSGFTPLKGAVRFGLSAIKGLGGTSVNAIIQARHGGLYSGLFDFCERVSPSAINKRVLETLICSGAFDSLGGGRRPTSWRPRLVAAIESALARGARAQRDRSIGQNDLFGSEVSSQGREPQLNDAIEWETPELLSREKDAVGFYITAHPLESFAGIIEGLSLPSTVEIVERESGSQQSIAGMVSGLQIRTTKKGDRFAIFQLEDAAGKLKCVLWPESFNRHSKGLKEGLPVMVEGKLEVSDEASATLIADNLVFLGQAARVKSRSIAVRIPAGVNPEDIVTGLFRSMSSNPGEIDVLIEVEIEAGWVVRSKVHSSLKVSASESLEADLKRLGVEFRWLAINGRSLEPYSEPLRRGAAY